MLIENLHSTNEMFLPAFREFAREEENGSQVSYRAQQELINCLRSENVPSPVPRPPNISPFDLCGYPSYRLFFRFSFLILVLTSCVAATKRIFYSVLSFFLYFYLKYNK